jgi:hypothetical protein
MSSVHHRLQTADFRFTLLGSHGEALKKPFEDDWQNTANYRYDDTKLTSHRGNHGICGGFGDLHIIDSDDLSRWGEMGVLSLIPDTFTIESRPDHRQFYVKCKEHFNSGGLFDPEKTELNKDGKPEYVHIGDIKAGAKDGICGGQAVAPGCRHPSGSVYLVVVDAPIAEVSRELLQSIISRFKTSKKVNGNYQKIEEQATKARQGRYEEKDDPLSTLRVQDIMPPGGNVTQSGDELRGDHPGHGSDNGGNYVINVSKNVWHCKRCESGGGPALAIAVKHHLISCSEAGPGELRGDLFKQVLEIAKEQYLPKPEEVAGTLLDKIKADHNALKESSVLSQMARMKQDDLVEYDLLIESIKRTHKGLKVDTIRQIVDKYAEESEHAAKEPAAIPKSVKEKALAIAERGDTVKFLIWQAQRNHIGDKRYQTVLIGSIASASSETSNGIQPGGNGDKGSGKSDACAATYHLVPMDRRLDGSLSPMSLFYLQEAGRLKPGMILFSDDVEYEPIIPIYKRATARFQQGITHFTVSGGKNREAVELRIPPRMVWWLTSVESVANEQAFDRQYPISTDTRPEHKAMVCEEIGARRARKELKLAEDEGIEVARAIISDIFDNGPFKVLIPQTKDAKWIRVADFRGQEQFWDMVDALAILRWRQRTIDSDGWLIADDADLIEAYDILNEHKMVHASNLTEREVQTVGVLLDGLPRTQKDISEALDIAQSTISERLKTIMAKSSAITEDWMDGRKVYTVSPSYKKAGWEGIELISLKIDSEKVYRSRCNALSGCYRYVIGLPICIIINNSSRIPSSLSVNMEGSIERGYPCDDCEKCPLRDVYLSLLSPVQKTDNEQKGQQEDVSITDNEPIKDPIDTDNVCSDPIETPIRHAVGVGPHPRKEDPHLEEFKEKVAARSRNTCALCGQHFEIPLRVWGPGGRICEPCRRDGTPEAAPQKADSQTKLEA